MREDNHQKNKEQMMQKNIGKVLREPKRDYVSDFFL